MPTAAILIDKLLIDGIEVHEATAPFNANGRDYPVGSWVVLMDQPFSPLVKELFEPQVWPDLRQSPNGPPNLPYDVAGWTLPMQMGVEVDNVLAAVAPAQRAGLRAIAKVVLPDATVEGEGKVFSFSHQANAMFQVANEALAAGGQVSFAAKDGALSVTGLDRGHMATIAKKYQLSTVSADASAGAAVASKKPRTGLYRPWAASIDEGWTRWILENYGFTPVTLRNADIQAGHLREMFDTIIIPDMRATTMRDGFAPGSIPGEFAGGLGESGFEALRDFVTSGGTLVALNNAGPAIVDAFGLPVTNILGAARPEEFFCSGSLLRIELKDTSHPALWGMAKSPAVFFERGPAYETKPGFKGAVLASYPKDRNPLASGYVLHPEKIQGKAAAVEVFYGGGRVYLFGFRPQWRGQSHGTYKLLFNAIYDSPASSKPTMAEAEKGPSPLN